MSLEARKRRQMRRTTPDNLFRYIALRTDGASPHLPHHWIHASGEIRGLGLDEGASFCPPCAEAKVAEIFASHPKEAERFGICVDGGWSTEHDSPGFCKTCGAKLEGGFTDYGFEEELDALTTYAAPTSADEPESWDALHQALGHVGGGETPLFDITIADRPPGKLDASIHDRWLDAWRRVRRIVRRVQKAERLSA